MKKFILPLLLLLIIGCGSDPIIAPEEHVHDSSCDHTAPAAPGKYVKDGRSGVRIFYLEPHGQRISDDLFELNRDKIRRSMEAEQIFFADQLGMVIHSGVQIYGRRTFRFEPERRFNGIQVQRLQLPMPAAFYIGHEDTKRAIRDHTNEMLGPIYDRDRHEIRVFFIDFNGAKFDFCGFGSDYGSSGHAFISGLCYHNTTLFHELGHAFGLPHDFRDNSYMMSYGGLNRTRLSPGAADWIARHPSFNPEPYNPDFLPMIFNLEVTSVLSFGENRWRVNFRFDSPLYDQELDLRAILIDSSKKYPQVAQYIPRTRFKRQEDGSYTFRGTGNMAVEVPRLLELRFIDPSGQIEKSYALWPE